MESGIVYWASSGKKRTATSSCSATEVFTWTDVDYAPGAGLLAVTGYIGVCPYSTIVLDFFCPLQPQPPGALA